MRHGENHRHSKNISAYDGLFSFSWLKKPTMSWLFTPLTLGPVTLPNRIIIAPMCQHATQNDLATPGITCS